MLFVIFFCCQHITEKAQEAISNESSIRLPITIDSYLDGGGMFFRVSLSLDGGKPFDVLLDTGSEGLRIFGSELPEESIPYSMNEISTAHTVQFGFSELMTGPLVQTNVQMGEHEELNERMIIHWIEEFSCLYADPNCLFAEDSAPFFTDMGIYGILGTSLRSGQESELYNPFSQLPEPYSNEYLIHWDKTSSTGSIQLGSLYISEEIANQYTSISLTPNGSLPNGMYAWEDDTIRGCFYANDTPIYAPCTELVLDSGSSADVVYTSDPDPDWIDWDILAPGVQFTAQIDDVFSYSFLVGHTPEPSIDLVFIDTVEPFSLLGIRFFMENDVGYNLQTGEIVLKANN